MPSSLSSNFMLNDLLLLLVATGLMPLFLLIPGYVVGWLSNLLDFRERRYLTRLLIGIVLSVSIFPAAVYLLACLIPFHLVFIPYAASWFFFLWLIFRERQRIRSALHLDGWTRTAVLLTFLWILVACISLPDIQLGERLYTNTVSADSQTRIALIDSIYRTGIPPVNPHIYPGKPVPVSYYYLWFMFPALLTSLTNNFIDARMSFYAGIIWAGIALRALACLYLRFRSPEANRSIGPRSVVAIGLFFITGLDIIFVSVILYFAPGHPFITEWWNGNSLVQAWTGALLWVPHHIAGLIAGITSILIFNSISRNMPFRRQALLVILTAFCVASLLGTSLYMAMVFAIFWGVYFIYCLLAKRWRYLLPWLTLVGLISILLASPFLLELLKNRASYSSQGGLLVFAVREFGFLRWLFMGMPEWQAGLINLVLLPVNYFVEFGFFLLAGLLYIQSAARDRSTLFARQDIEILLLSIGFLLCSFFRSNIVGNNDLGWRGLLPVQFILLIWGANILVVWQSWFGKKELADTMPISAAIQRTLVLLLIIGFASTLLDVGYLRIYSILDEKEGWTNDLYHVQLDNWGLRLYAVRDAYQFMNTSYPITVIVQNNPEYEHLMKGLGLYGMRQTVAAGEEFSILYGDPPDLYHTVSAQILPLFQDPSLSWREVQNICQASKIDLLMIKDVDPVWKNANSWVWKETPDFQNNFVRLFACR